MLDKDCIKIVAFVKVFITPIYSKKYFSIDHGKYNLESYFKPKGWSNYRIKKAIKKLKNEGFINKEKADNLNLYSLSIIHFN